MQRSFGSKTGIWLFILLILGLGLLIWSLWFRHPVGAALCAVVSIFLIQALLRTDYVVRADGLLILTAGFLPVKTIGIRTIRSIEARNGLPGIYALSADGMDVVYGEGKRVRLSPKDRTGFVTELKKYNPAIEIRE